MKFITWFFVVLVLVTVIVYFYYGNRIKYGALYAQDVPMSLTLNSVDDIKKIIPQSPAQIDTLVKQAIVNAQKIIDAILAVPADKRTYANTIKVYDDLALSDLSFGASICQILEMVSPDQSVREAAHRGYVELEKFSIDKIYNNKELYDALVAYNDGNRVHEKLGDQETYFVNYTIEQGKRKGFDKSPEVRKQIDECLKQLSILSNEFESNIAKDVKDVKFTQDELAGIDENTRAGWSLDTDGKYIIPVNPVNYQAILEHSTVEATRKKMWQEYATRAYPANDDVLKNMRSVRQELAQLLDYQNFAAYDLDDQMMKTPADAYQFLHDILQRVSPKVDQEFANITKNLPDDIKLNGDGRIDPWNEARAVAYYKKNNFQIDEREIAEYFPADHTLNILLKIYEKFFSLVLTQKQINGLWYDDLRLIEVKTQEGAVLAYVILDLYPRAHKYTHACHAGIIPATFKADGSPNTKLSVVIANFPPATAGRPPLLNRSDVTTFFHEFGHAIHSILGRTRIASLSGTATKTDFVEMPSQMLEEWLFDPHILKIVSLHYKTGESLPDELINKILATKNMYSGTWVQRQGFLSLVSLDLFDKSSSIPTSDIYYSLYKQTRPHMLVSQDDKGWSSFGHLSGYGAKYYGYLFSKGFAREMFEYIENIGLLDPRAGAHYKDTVLSWGGTQDPNTLLYNFLGRKPTIDAFIKNLGL